jgi:hypothetical protein
MDKINKNDAFDTLIKSCFRIKASQQHLSFADAIIYQQLEHDFGTYQSPSNLFKALKAKAIAGDPGAEYSYSLVVRTAFKMTKSKWIGRDDGVINSKDWNEQKRNEYYNYDEKVSAEAATFLLKAANAGHKEAMYSYIGLKANPYVTALHSELTLALKFAHKLKELQDPRAQDAIEALNLLIKEWN